MKKATLHDIAKHANTSTATVSRVLNKTGYPVKEDLKNKILKAAEELNYYPNLAGKQLKGKKIKEVGVIIPNITNPFYNSLISGVESTIRDYEYYLVLCNTNGDAQLESKYLEYFYQKQIEGIILSSVKPDIEYLKFLQSNNVRIVSFEQDIELDCHKVNFDYYRGGYLAAEHLIKKGHRDIGFISAPLSRYSRIKVFEGFKGCLDHHGIELKEEYAKIGDHEISAETFEYQNGKMLVDELIQNDTLPTAIFCINDMTAFGVIQQLQLHNIRVPEDVAIVGFDNIDISEMVTPALTTIDQNSFEMGRLAAEALINNLEKGQESNVTNVLQPALVERKST